MEENAVLYTSSSTRKKEYQQEIKEDSLREVERFKDMASQDAQVIAKIKTIFPFKFFPTTAWADRSKITINDQYFFGCYERKTVFMKDIMTVSIESDLFFATLKIEDRLFPTEVATIRFLPKQEAEKFRMIVEGLRQGIQENVDFTHVPRIVIAKQAERLGGVQGTPPIV